MVIRVRANNTNRVIVAVEPLALTTRVGVRIEKPSKLATTLHAVEIVGRPITKRRLTLQFIQMMMGSWVCATLDGAYGALRHVSTFH